MFSTSAASGDLNDTHEDHLQPAQDPDRDRSHFGDASGCDPIDSLLLSTYPREMKVFEVDEHHHILLADAVVEAVREEQGGVLLNFDSHDDWGIPDPSKKSKCSSEDLRRLILEKVSSLCF
jgi:hypothetical protein